MPLESYRSRKSPIDSFDQAKVETTPLRARGGPSDSYRPRQWIIIGDAAGYVAVLHGAGDQPASAVAAGCQDNTRSEQHSGSRRFCESIHAAFLNCRQSAEKLCSVNRMVARIVKKRGRPGFSGYRISSFIA